MSTHLYLVCHDHQPPIHSDDEVGQHLRDLPDIRKEVLHRQSRLPGHSLEQLADMSLNQIYQQWDRGRPGKPGDPLFVKAYFGRHAAQFLVRHPHCTVGIVDEYGTPHPLEPESRIDN